MIRPIATRLRLLGLETQDRPGGRFLVQVLADVPAPPGRHRFAFGRAMDRWGFGDVAGRWGFGRASNRPGSGEG